MWVTGGNQCFCRRSLNSSQEYIFSLFYLRCRKGINSVGNAVFSWNENAKSKKTLRAENERLQEKIDVLKMQNRVLEQNQVELERLQDLLKLKQKYKKYHTVGARVISKGSEKLV